MEVIMEIKKIDISSIYLQQSIQNRNENEVAISSPFLELVDSIRKIGLIHPITVRKNKNGKYELHVGSRRLLAYRQLAIEYKGYDKCKEYQTILAIVLPPQTKSEEMFLKNMHENQFRSDQDSVESIEARISAVPFFLECGVEGEIQKNKELGYKILKLYMSYHRSRFKKNENIDKIKKLTNCDDPLKGLDIFFQGIKEEPRTFFDKANVIINASKDIKSLMQTKIISLRTAKSLRAMKSDLDRFKLIQRLLGKEYIPNKKLLAIIKESNAKENPLKKQSELLSYSKNIFVLLEDKKIDLGDKEYKKIKAYLYEIEKTLLGER